MVSSKKLSQLPADLVGVEQVGGSGGPTGERFLGGRGGNRWSLWITETWDGEFEGVAGSPGSMSRKLKGAGTGDDGAELGRVTITDLCTGISGMERLG